MTTVNFRHEARQSLARAKALLATNDEASLRYAALDLRMTMEAVVYDKMGAYKAEIPQIEYETWQPTKVLKALLEIDPKADQSVTIAMGIEDTPGVPAPQMSLLGTETPLSHKTLRGNYDAISNYLHMPTIKQFATKGGADMIRLRERCEALVTALDAVLEGSLFNVSIGQFTVFDCFRCGKEIRKRFTVDSPKEMRATCIHCNAPHRVIADGDEYLWTSIAYDVQCADPTCDGRTKVFEDQVVEWGTFSCVKCGISNTMTLGSTLTSRVAPPT